MKPRARRAMALIAGLGAVLVAVMVAANWATVRDHIDAWRFQLTRETEITGPRSLNEGQMLTTSEMLARYSKQSVIYDPTSERGTVWSLSRNASLDHVLILLRHDRYRVIEQRLPRRAYVLVRTAADPIAQSVVMPQVMSPQSVFRGSLGELR